MVEFNVPTYLGLYPSFLVFVLNPGLRPRGFPQAVGCHHLNGGSYQFFWISYNGISLSTSPPPRGLYKSLLLELVCFRTAWEPSIASSFTPFPLFPPAWAYAAFFRGRNSRLMCLLA